MSTEVTASFFDGVNSFMNGSAMDIRSVMTEELMKKRHSSVKFYQRNPDIEQCQFSSSVMYIDGSYYVTFWGPYDYIDRGTFQSLYSALRMAHFWCV